VLDTKGVQAHENPPPVLVEDAIVNGKRERPSDIATLAPGQKNIQFNYTGLSLLAPTQITFRYMLQGYDSDWIEAGTRREAYYTNLPPGRFQFKVTACNAENQCSPTGTSVAFILAPYYYQRPWFWPVVALLAAGAVFLGYRLRVHRLRFKYDVILNERSRIARELHDTLMQGFSGVTIAIQAVATRLGNSDERQRLEKIIHNAENCLQETRRSIEGLRSAHSDDYGFAAAVANTARDIVGSRDIRLTLRLDQQTPSPAPEIEYNLLRVLAEAISNAVRHSGARNIEVAMKSTADTLCLAVTDDGSGFARNQASARTGHYGLIGMQERASQIGAQLELRSEPGNGTTVFLTLPSLARDRVEATS
jgi:signal transduction histidine kinase